MSVSILEFDSFEFEPRDKLRFIIYQNGEPFAEFCGYFSELKTNSIEKNDKELIYMFRLWINNETYQRIAYIELFISEDYKKIYSETESSDYNNTLRSLIYVKGNEAQVCGGNTREQEIYFGCRYDYEFSDIYVEKADGAADAMCAMKNAAAAVADKD
jgi:hypothetical protein